MCVNTEEPQYNMNGSARTAIYINMYCSAFRCCHTAIGTGPNWLHAGPGMGRGTVGQGSYRDRTATMKGLVRRKKRGGEVCHWLLQVPLILLKPPLIIALRIPVQTTRHVDRRLSQLPYIVHLQRAIGLQSIPPPFPPRRVDALRSIPRGRMAREVVTPMIPLLRGHGGRCTRVRMVG